ncbi:MAG: hypothetical protein ACT6RF_04120 [Allorhizobium sp.]|uniref:hypothetical protein n=1 Tax=Allorhizobium sp. TaxID=633478 RepID=UPI0040346FEE
MISATERLTPKSWGILQWLWEAFRWGSGPRRLRPQDLPADLRRDIGLEMEDHVLRGRELAAQRLLDLTRPGVM